MNNMAIQRSVSLEKFLRVLVSGAFWNIFSKVKDKFPTINKEAQPSLWILETVFTNMSVLLSLIYWVTGSWVRPGAEQGLQYGHV